MLMSDDTQAKFIKEAWALLKVAKDGLHDREPAKFKLAKLVPALLNLVERLTQERDNFAQNILTVNNILKRGEPAPHDVVWAVIVLEAKEVLGETDE